MKYQSLEDSISGVAILPQAMTAGQAYDGATITKPHLKGRLLQFIVMSGALTSVSALKIKVQGMTAAGDWEDVQSDTAHGTAVDLQFDAAETLDDADLENGVLMGHVPIDRLPYESYRLVVETLTGGNAVIGAVYLIKDLFDHPSPQKDQLFFKATPYTESAPLKTQA